ncbi:polynucleotide 5'-hydroxyl-kinase NOL9-like [Zophobas morio]|uniref:polynucleotide 5'-hydroxyl-kinase NOL9-like n=1 Tax=Zophobas morio TaxID=2755281 RepID=UPI00308394C5
MNKTHLGDDVGRKRKSRNRHKSKKLKRSRIFQETSFDSSDDNETSANTTPSKRSDSLEYQFKVLNLTPSKSECDTSKENAATPSDCAKDASSFWSEFDLSRDEDVSYAYGSIIEEFACDDGNQSYSEVVSAEVNGLNESTDEEVPQNVIIMKKTKSKKTEGKTVKKKAKVDDPPVNNLLMEEAQFYFRDDGIIVILEKNQTIYFHGLCSVSVLHGQVEVLGHVLTKNSPEAKLYSFRGSSLLYLKNITESDIPISSYLLPNKIKLSEKCALVFCKKLHDPGVLFMEKHISQQILPRQEQDLPRVVFQPKEGSWNLLQVSQDWNHVINEVDKNTKLMICGGKGVGKTTFLRYAINRLLMKFSEIRVIDLDPGQSEFTVPGCISIVRVNTPLFGVNYTHLQQTERSILSNINIAYEPEKYIAGVKELVSVVLDEIPTLINYMGYTHGVGINILSAVITQIQPTDVLQICSQNSKKNYKFSLKTGVIKQNAKLFVSEKTNLNYNLHQIESMCDGNDSWTAEPRQLREMCVLSYISHLVDSNSVFKSKGPMYRINLNDIIISDLNGDEVHPAAINASLVALCRLSNKEEHIFQCFSWGVVRGVDVATNELVLLTSTKIDTLNDVTHLVSNGVSLPPSVYMTPDDIQGPMPYVIEGLLMSFGQIPKRSRMSVK